ncbi:hypothetical protein [Spiroplasma endosymbiont of Agriotes lineatus]|uniref:hypothetical protein n=1 Tax=Spiroplasma endosymbiont of Agriotes lineatus TaxID=3077930 RepID=UPI0030D4DE9F
MTINLKEFNWEQIKQTFWDLFIQITTIPANITGGKEIKLTEVPLWLLIANIAFWLLTAIMVWFILKCYFEKPYRYLDRNKSNVAKLHCDAFPKKFKIN